MGQARLTHAAGLAVDHLGSIVRPQGAQRVEHGRGQHVAARGPAVAEDAVVQPHVGRALVHAKQRRARRQVHQRMAGFAHPDKGRQVSKTNVGMQVAIGIEQRGTKLQRAKAAATFPAHGLADATLFTVDYLVQPRQAMRERMLAALDADPAPAHLVRDGGGGAAAEEAVEDEVIWIRCN